MAKGFPSARRTARNLLFHAARLLGCVLLAWLAAWNVGGASVVLAWNPAAWADSYNVYYGQTSGDYTDIVSAGDTNEVTIGGLDPNTTYYFAVTTIVGGLESDFSDEITFTTPAGSVPLLSYSVSGGLQVTGQAGHTYDVLASQDLLHWRSIGTITAADGTPLNFVDPEASKLPARYYLLHDLTFLTNAPGYTLLTTTPGGVQLLIEGWGGHTYEVLATQDFISWSVIGTVTLGLGGSTTFTDPTASGSFRFYHLRDITGL